MDERELGRRTQIYGLVQLFALIIGVLGFGIWIYFWVRASVSLQADIWLIILGFGIFIVSGIANNLVYFWTLGYPSITEWRRIALPSVVLILLIAATIFFVFNINILHLGYDVSKRTQVLLSMGLTFFWGFLAFFAPMILQYNSLNQTDQKGVYDRLIFDLDQNINSRGAQLLSPTSDRREKEELYKQINKIENDVGLMAGIYFREHLFKKRYPIDLFRIASITFGPIVSLIIYFLK
jgi:hypothetical protein